MFNQKQLAAMREAEITNIARAKLVDISMIPIDGALPVERKMAQFLEQVGNPYCFLCGDTPVRVRFVSNEKTLTQSLSNYFISLK